MFQGRRLLHFQCFLVVQDEFDEEEELISFVEPAVEMLMMQHRSQIHDLKLPIQ